MKSPLATIAGIVLLVLIAVDTCPSPQLIQSQNDTNAAIYPQIFAGHQPLLWKLPILDIMLLLLLVWFLNREIEISYRLCYHGDVEAVSDRKKIQVCMAMFSVYLFI